MPIVGHVELPFDIAMQRQYLDVLIMNELDANCILGTDFIRAFNAVLFPRDLAHDDNAQRKQLQDLLDEKLPLGCMPLA